MDSNLRREIILSHYENPVNRGLTDEDGYILKNTNNDSCIDNIDIMVKVEDGIIKDIRFDGEACAISTSATSVMISTLLGKSIDEAKKILENYKNMIDEKDYDKDLLGELNVYDEVSRQPNRKMCALLPRNAISSILDELEK